MFTGIIEQVGRIQEVEPLAGGRRITIECGFAGELAPDQSVSVNGICQTVTSADATSFEMIAVEETLAKTTVGCFRAGDLVNLERAMRPDARLDGHIVQGHVDTTGRIAAVEPLDDSTLVHVIYPAEFARFLIPVGSIAVDGISLTVARLDEDRFTVSIIPHTAQLTTAHSWKSGSRVNLEFDLIGKYVARWMETRGREDGG